MPVALLDAAGSGSVVRLATPELVPIQVLRGERQLHPK
jgi:hypothetical protein